MRSCRESKDLLNEFGAVEGPKKISWPGDTACPSQALLVLSLTFRENVSDVSPRTTAINMNRTLASFSATIEITTLNPTQTRSKSARDRTSDQFRRHGK